MQETENYIMCFSHLNNCHLQHVVLKFDIVTVMFLDG